MPRLKKVPCAHCDAKMAGGTSFCPNCEQPTVWASHEERTEWELRQWSQKRSSRSKRRVSTETAEVTPIQSRRAAAQAPKAIVRHPAAPAVAPTAPVVSPAKVRPARAAKPERVTPPASPARVPAKKHVARSKPEPVSAPVAAKAARRPAAKKTAPAPEAVPAVPAGVQEAPAAPADIPSIDLTAAPMMPDHAAQQTEILRELLQHVISIEEKINGNGSRRLRLLKRSG